MLRWTLALLLLAFAFVGVSCGGDGSTDGFRAGAADQFAPTSITTYTDGDVREVEPEASAAGDLTLEGTLVFHLVRLESGDFIALSARDPHSECWVPWQPEFEFEGRTGWFGDPCDGSLYDEEGVRVFGPAPRDLDRYPVEIRDGEVYVNLAEDALIPGAARVESVDPTATSTPSPEATDSPATPTSTATAAPATASPTAEASESPPMAEGSPYDAADLVNALAAAGIEYAPRAAGIACEGAGARGDTYGPASTGDPDLPPFTLWVYPSSTALRSDWELPSSGPPTTNLDDCPLETRSAFWNVNLLLVLGDASLWAGHQDVREQIVDTFLGLGDAAASR